MNNNKQFKRICPNCEKPVWHTNKNNRNRSEKKKKICNKCRGLNFSETHRGENNTFYGKHHTIKVKQKLSKQRKGKHNSPDTEMKKECCTLNKTPLIEIWTKNYGIEEANKRLQRMKNKLSLLSSGKNNAMYGKPSPKGSGNGWSGWYKNWYFRSINELSYFINVIERFKIKWNSGELKKYKIKYIDFNGKERNYFPDFVLNDKYMIECKPKKLWKTDLVKRKTAAAILFCSNHQMKYKLIECKKLSIDEMKVLHDTGDIKFIERYEEKYNRLITI